MINDYKDLVIEYNKYESTDSKTAFLSRQDRIGNIAKFLSVDLENALNNNDLKIYYQTQINYKNEIFGMEALLRWNHPDYGFIYPPLIISLADEANLCHILGNWVIEQSCSDLRILNSNGLTDIVMSVNIISEQLESNSFIPFLSRIMNVYNIKKQTLQIEITERLALENRKDILEKILSLKELGIKLAIDDFGMGHSSLMYLKEYDFDTVKIDGSLIKEILSNSNCSSIVSSIIRLGSSLNFSVLAEYVETEEQRNCLHELGCDNYQGYLYSPAITFDELLDYVKVSMII
jgi:EAL domain-containing protein (putative c-di-GMP-specific phosphodiesterase class I)